MLSLTIDTPTGPFTLTEKDSAIVRAGWGGSGADRSGLLDQAASQVQAYFDGTREAFDLPLAPDVSEVQGRFLDALLAIPFGQTRTYGDMAKELGVSAQAAGQLCGANPIALIIPCHRVLGANSLGGFSAPDGVETKVWLLRHEGAAGLLI